jgi:periplasmic divalent cation tolerance protein
MERSNGSQESMPKTSGSEPLLMICTTVAQMEQAQRIARELIESRWAACVQIDGPIESWYRWEGQLESSREFRLQIKTLPSCRQAVLRCLERLHPYEVPELLSIEAASSTAYHRWVSASVDREKVE